MLATEYATPHAEFQNHRSHESEPSVQTQFGEKKTKTMQIETKASSTGPLHSLQAIGLNKQASEGKDGKIRLSEKFKVTTPSARLALL